MTPLAAAPQSHRRAGGGRVARLRGARRTRRRAREGGGAVPAKINLQTPVPSPPCSPCPPAPAPPPSASASACAAWRPVLAGGPPPSAGAPPPSAGGRALPWGPASRPGTAASVGWGSVSRPGTAASVGWAPVSSRPATAAAGAPVAAVANPLFGDRPAPPPVPPLRLPPHAGAVVARPSWFGDLPSPGRLTAPPSEAGAPRTADSTVGGGWNMPAVVWDRPPTAGLPWGGAGATPRAAAPPAHLPPPPPPPSALAGDSVDAARPPFTPASGDVAAWVPRPPPATADALVPFMLRAAPLGAPPVRCTLLRGKGCSSLIRVLLDGDAPGSPGRQVAVAARAGRRARVVTIAPSTASSPPIPAALVKANWARSAYLALGPRGGQLAACAYAASLLGGRGPRRLRVLLPRGPGVGSLAARAEAGDAGVACLANVPPRWAPRAGAYVLDFGGRVTRASVKNFQLVERGGDGGDEGGEGGSAPTPILQFGRCGDDAFALDYSHPLTGLQAVVIALTALDGKLTCE